VIPQRAEARVAPLDWFDVGGDIGWTGGGADLRLGLPGNPERVWAGNIAAGLRSGELGPFKATKATRSQWLRLEAYPLIAGRYGRLVLAGGAHWGTFYHQLNTGRDPEDDGDGLTFDAVQVVRREVRIETAIGYHQQLENVVSVMFAAEPYCVVDSGPAVESACAGCETADFRQSFGVVFVLRGTFMWVADPD
jgi:hypothetical protein